MKPSAANLKKVKFAQSVFGGKSQQDAALAAGYRPGKGLAAVASKLMKDPVVTAELDRLRAKADELAVATRREALKVLSAELRADISDFLTFKEVTTEGGVTRFPVFDLEKARGMGRLNLLRGIELDEFGRIKKIKLPDSAAAIDRLAKMLGWNTPEEHHHDHTLRFAEMTTHEIETFLAKTVAESGVQSPKPKLDAGGAVHGLAKVAKPAAPGGDKGGDARGGDPGRGSAARRL